MNSRFAAALRLILPLPSRCAAVDFLGVVDLFTDDFLVEDFADLVEPALDFEEVLLEEERLDEERPPFCAFQRKHQQNEQPDGNSCSHRKPPVCRLHYRSWISTRQARTDRSFGLDKRLLGHWLLAIRTSRQFSQNEVVSTACQ